jgi:predicted nucleotidyltransferase
LLSHRNQVETIKQTISQAAVEILEKYPVLLAYLYGSFATGDVHPFSDIDIGVYIDNLPATGYLEVELATSLEFDRKLPAGIQSEVRIVNDLPISITGVIVTEGILIYCKDESVRIDFETSVRKAYFDFLPVLRKYQNEYINSAISPRKR